MNEQIRNTVKQTLDEKRMSQAGLSRLLGKHPAAVNRCLTSTEIPATWEEILDALDLQLIAVPKDKKNSLLPNEDMASKFEAITKSINSIEERLNELEAQLVRTEK